MVSKCREFFFEVLDTRERVLLVYALVAGAVLLLGLGKGENRRLREQMERDELAEAIARRLR